MKTTIELPEGLLEEAKRVARREGLTMKALFEQGLRRVLDERKGPKKGFRLPDASVTGKGLAPDVKVGGWEAIRDLAYREHGA